MNNTQTIKLMSYICIAMFVIVFFYLFALIKTVNNLCDTVMEIQDSQDQVVQMVNSVRYMD